MAGMLLLLAIGLLILVCAGLLTVVVVLDIRRWRSTLHAFHLQFPRDLAVNDAARWLASIAAVTHPTRWSLFPSPPLVLEVVADANGIRHYILVDAPMRDKLLATVQATLPGARLNEEPGYLHQPNRSTGASEFTMTNRSRSLAIDRSEPVSSSLLAALQPLNRNEHFVVQFIMTSAGTPSPVLGAQASADADEVRALRVKQRDPLLAITLRIGVTAASRQQASALLSRADSMPQGLNAPGVKLVRRFLPSFVVVRRLAARSYPLIAWPLLLNVREAAGLAALPFTPYLPGLTVGRARQLPPPSTLPTLGNVLGFSNYPGIAGRPLALSPDDRLRHVHLIGPTGTGKSTLLAQMAIRDIIQGYGVVVVDPKGDLVNDIAARVPASRHADVIVLDPSEAQTAVVGFNPLRGAPGDEATRELIADHVLSIFHSIYREFWGPRTDEILRAALFSLTHIPAPDGSAFTLIEVPELLTNPSLRRYVSRHAELPSYLRSFWQWFDGSLKENDRVQAIGPVLNKLRAFSMRSSIRLMLGQSQGIDLSKTFREQGVLLISLAKGKIGSEAASLLGSLFVATLWQAIQARIALPADERHPLFAYLDEFQDIVRFDADNDLADMLAQARGLGLSLTLAHQYLHQLPGTVREATLGTVRTHIVFQLEWDDARTLDARFAPLSRDDLSGLAPFEFVMKPCVAGETLAPVTGTTLPLGKPLLDSALLAHASRKRYGMKPTAIEAGLQARLGVANSRPSGRFGREDAGGLS